MTLTRRTYVTGVVKASVRRELSPTSPDGRVVARLSRNLLGGAGSSKLAPS